ncbi:lytic transglycosylase domain-containing protein [Aminobacter sp. NyZ550]|uniref:lytic transglycosylase domain-containing protein n=1 Tax=Aminobacter TaxID=31988 RepID=UPI0012B154FD|nr:MULTISPECIES: lytic transglycosylase domain-containing protein [Aminobacter]MRX33973.1 transglycosylase SLT domain-containing protein [Aminobacter sp. MDW-2]QNH33997.1 lytic transglycosylase domain-containing protein [Aminobacter sp. MDW-2]WAX94931.1 lytic transglycosylase domain-containing protein [Aminobacter sp. NyZ550]
MPCRNVSIASRLRPTRSRSVAGQRHPVRRFALRLLSGLLLSACSVGPCIAQANAVPTDPYAAHIAEASRRFAVPAAWIHAVLGKESAGDERAVSSAGALGLMQIMPGTWDELRARWLLGQDPFDPRDNILAGTAYLREMHDRFGSPGFLAAYNAGPARYEAYLNGHPLPAETLAYVETLSPLIDGGSFTEWASTPVASGGAATLPWPSSPLFVRAAAGTEPTPFERENSAAAERSVMPDAIAIKPRSNCLFAARTGMGDPF